MGEWHSDQYGCTKLLFTHTTQNLSKALLGAIRNRNCWIVSWFAVCQLRFTRSWSACFAARLAASSALLRSCLAF